MESRGLNVLSLFDGMSCARIALRELDIKVDRYYASEINKHAIKQTQLNFPDTIQLGDVRDVHAKDLPKIDLICGGSPCQGFSFAGKQLNFNDPRSALFFEFVRILNECREVNPDVKFLLENVRMKREYEQVISDALGIKPVMINSALVSAQNRVRLYWSNIRTAPDGLFEIKTDIPQPKDRGLFLRDILEDDVDAKWFLSQKMIDWLNKHSNKRGVPIRLVNGYCKSSCLTATAQVKQNLTADYLIVQRPRGNNKGGTVTDKSPTLSSNAWEQNNILCISSNQAHATVSANKSTPLVAAMGMGGGHAPMIANDEIVRRITPTEAARLQTIPEWYKWECSATQQYTMLGNGWTVEVIKHIFSFL